MSTAVVTTIDEKYAALGRASGWLGQPTTPELDCPDLRGCFRHFEGGSIYWTPQTGAYEVHGAIRDKWAALGWEASFLGYPLTDETTTPDGRGRYNHFEGGSIYWTPQTGAWEVHGAIRDKWAELGWETGFLGYPLSDETITPDGHGRFSRFQGGFIHWTPEQAAKELDAFLVPGLVLGLRHNMNQQLEAPNVYAVSFSAAASAPAQRMDGGDLGAPIHRGYEWWMIQDDVMSNPAAWSLPPGVVLGLKHSQNQAHAGITVFGHDPCSGPNFLPGLKKQVGGDLGAPKGQGYYWYETTGEGFTDWNLVERLPRWTILGLKHSRNNRGKTFSWQGRTYDPANPNITPPQGFVRVAGGDRGGGEGEDYCWYEKVTGPEIVVRPALSVTLDRSLLVGPQNAPEEDLDGDGLVDDLENRLANAFRPYIIFDSDEAARIETPQYAEPVTLFQVHPLDLRNPSNLRVAIKWVFLFRKDGGYGPDVGWTYKEGTDSHDGDDDDALYVLESRDGGTTWTLIRAVLSSRAPDQFAGSDWPKNSRLEVYDLTHPIIYMSAHKHHEYFTRDWDGQDSLYSHVPGFDDCNDDVNGRGARMLVDLQSLAKMRPDLAGAYNNVGESSTHHPTPPFVDDLNPIYPGFSAWGDGIFYSDKAGSISKKWIATE